MRRRGFYPFTANGAAWWRRDLWAGPSQFPRYWERAVAHPVRAAQGKRYRVGDGPFQYREIATVPPTDHGAPRGPLAVKG